MRLGFNLPQLGPAASPDAITTAAKRAEELGYDSVWVTERLLYPVQPQTPYMGTPDGSLPEVYKIAFDPPPCPDLCRGSYLAHCPGYQYPGYALLQPGPAGAELDHVGRALRRPATSRARSGVV